jgi:hypothetical protein
VLLTTPRALAAAGKVSTVMARIGAAVRADQLANIELAARGREVAAVSAAASALDDAIGALNRALEAVQSAAGSGSGGGGGPGAIAPEGVAAAE